MTPRPSQLVDLFETHKEGLCGAIVAICGRRADVYEILQDAFVRVLKASREGRIHLDPVGFIFVVTLNLARDARRRETVARSRATQLDGAIMDLPAQEAPPTSRAEQSETVAAARAAIETLSDREKEVFFLRVSGGLSFEGVAEQLRIPVGTAKTRMRTALATLRQRLRSHTPTADLERGTP